jgi:hypothetical protein
MSLERYFRKQSALTAQINLRPTSVARELQITKQRYERRLYSCLFVFIRG